MIIEMPEDNSIIRWKYKDKWKCAEISDLILTYEKQERGGECMDIPIQDNCLNCIHKNVCYKSAWQTEPCKDKIEENTNLAK